MLLLLLILASAFLQAWCNENVLFGKDEALLELAHFEGARKAAEFVRDSTDYQPAEQTIMESLDFVGNPELFQVLLTRSTADTLQSNNFQFLIVEKIIETGMINALRDLIDPLPDDQKMSVLQFAWDLALDRLQLRIAVWILQNYSEIFAELINSNSPMHTLIRAFTLLTKDELSAWLVTDIVVLPEDDHGDRLAFDVLLLILERRLHPKIFRHIFSEHKHVLHSHNMRLEMLITMIENEGSDELLPLIIGKISDSSRLWLSFVEEKEITWRLLRHGRLDLLVKMIRTEFATDTSERNLERILSFLAKVQHDWKTYRDLPSLRDSKVGVWMRRFIEEDETIAVRLIPMLGCFDLQDPVGQAAFQIAWSIIWNRGIFINFLEA